MAKKVQILYGGKPIWPRTSIDNVVDPNTGEPASIGSGGGGEGTTPTSVKYASSAGLASGLTSNVKSDIISSAVAAVPTVTSVLSATSAEIAYGLDDTLKEALIASATPAPITSVAEAGVASSVTNDVKTDILASVNITSVASAGIADDIAATVKTSIIESAVASVPAVTSVASAGIASDIIATVKSSIIDSAVAAVPAVTSVVSASHATYAEEAGYNGPFKVAIDGTNVTIASGTYYLGDALSVYAGTSVISSTGNVYFYVYYSNGYHSGVEIASSAAALTNAALITGSAGYYTVLASVSDQHITQYQYGQFRIDGRVL